MAAEGSSESLTEYCTFVSVQSKVKIFIERIQVPFLTLATHFAILGTYCGNLKATMQLRPLSPNRTY